MVTALCFVPLSYLPLKWVTLNPGRVVGEGFLGPLLLEGEGKSPRLDSHTTLIFTGGCNKSIFGGLPGVLSPEHQPPVI